MSDHWEALDRNSIRAAEAKFGVRHPRHHEAALDDLCPNSGASKGVCTCVSCRDTTVSERRILTDLIAELRRSSKPLPEDRRFVSPLHPLLAVERAEARLREVQGE